MSRGLDSLTNSVSCHRDLIGPPLLMSVSHNAKEQGPRAHSATRMLQMATVLSRSPNANAKVHRRQRYVYNLFFDFSDDLAPIDLR